MVLPHPYTSRDLFEIHFLERVDFIEVWNGRGAREQDNFAEKLQVYVKAKPIIGCDAHQKAELNNCYLTFASLDEFKRGNMKFFINRKSKRYNRYLSYVTGDIREKNYKKLLRDFVLYLVFTLLGK